MGIRIRCSFLIALACVARYAVPQSEPGRFALSQVTYQYPVLRVYVDVLDQDGRSPAMLGPVDFTATIDQQTLKVNSVTPFTQSGEGIAYAFLVDVSKSIQLAQFNLMRSEIDAWINGLNADDRMAIFTFGNEDKELTDFTSDKSLLISALQKISPTDNQTKLYLALRNAIDLGKRVDANLPNRRVIVILSDGKDEGSGFTADDVGRMVQQSPLPIYAIGLSRLPPKERNTYLEALNRIASLSGGLYVDESSLSKAYTEIRDAIHRVFIVQLACELCQVSSQSQPLQMTLKSGTAVRTDRLAVSLILSQQPPATESLWEKIKARISLKLVLYAIGALTVVITLPVVIIVAKRPEKKEEKDVAPLPPHPDPPKPTPTLVGPAVVLPSRRIELTVLTGNDRGHVDTVNLTAKAVVGRDKQCNVSYPGDSEMSAKHFELILTGEHIEVNDLGSTNGTLLNGSRLVTQQRIEDGDWVRAGRTEVRITFGA
jgi:VWFA-related protein